MISEKTKKEKKGFIGQLTPKRFQEASTRAPFSIVT
jgi:hypothetical protein